MTGEISRYHIVEFDNHEQHLSFIDNLQQFLPTQEGLEFIRDSPPCMMLISDSFPLHLYLSPGAAKAAQEAGLSFKPERDITPQELPDDIELLIDA